MPSSVAETNDSEPVPTRTSWPRDWRKFTNFNGTIYYTADEEKLITTDDASDPTIREMVLDVYHTYCSECFQEIDSGDEEMHVYNVDESPRMQLASWSRGETYDYDTENSELIVERSQLFWDYAWEFPMHRRYLPPEREAEFVNALAFVSNDRACDGNAKSIPFDEVQIKRIWQTYQELKAYTTPLSGDLFPALVYHMGRVMHELAWARIKNNYGTLTVISPAPDSASDWEVATCDVCLALILCGTHENYRVRLEGTVPNGKILLPKFRNLVRTLLSEWADSNLVATVLVSVNVGFLGIPGLTALQRSASIVSSLCALTSLITGLHHVWQHREKTDTEHDDAKEYLYFFKLFTQRGPRKTKPTTLDMTLTAALLAIPLASLQWAVVSFMVAIAAYAFGAADHALVLVVVAALFVMASAMFVYFWQLGRALRLEE
ncbi:hypothetical protein B0H12DRAFT_1161088 [Mycena haematopus]|nr:hypothetical protein B0H12DRAFT_1161088 [Mycena haematopus]